MDSWWPTIAGLAIGALLSVTHSRWKETRELRSMRDAERARADEATNRLLSAWKDGFVIPEPVADVIDEEPLPPVLAEWLTQWEDPTAREKFEADLRRKLAQGRTPDQILMDLELAS